MVKRGLPNKGRQKITPSQALTAYAESGTLAGAAKKLGVVESCISRAVAKLKGSEEYQAVIRPQMDKAGLETAATVLLNTTKVKQSLEVIPPGWDFIRSWATVVDKIGVLCPAAGVTSVIPIKIDVHVKERGQRWKESLKFTPVEVVETEK